MKLVLISDLHIGYHNRREELARWIDLVNAEEPDLVLIGGDIIDGSMRPLIDQRMHEEFRRLKAPVYACIGNHEYYSGEPRARQFYKDAGIQLLQDSCAVVGDLCLIGRDDNTNMHRLPIGKLMQQADRSKYCILLVHQPHHLEQAEQQHVDFQFSGHTHHGQIWPFRGLRNMSTNVPSVVISAAIHSITSPAASASGAVSSALVPAQNTSSLMCRATLRIIITNY